MNRPVIIIPGYQNSGPGHWQSLWESNVRGAIRVEMPNWDFPRKEEWVEALDATLGTAWQETETPAVLVGHSIGCLTILHWAADPFFAARWPVKAALLVAPADVERKDCPEVLRSFGPIPMGHLPFPSRVVASSDDPLLSLERAKRFAESWGSTFTDVGNCGHINTASGFGEWPRGEAMLQELM
ncbi:MAG: alpha/beta hydrolase [Holophagaceae bacterium]|nr:alpha/beta hydrolase [Holophagaceae bacterium]